PVAAGAQALSTRYGPRPVLAAGFVTLTAGMILYAQIPVHGEFLSNLLPGYLLVGVGLALGFIAVSIAALAGVPPRPPGVAFPSGCALAFGWLAGIGAAGIVLSWALVRPEARAVPKKEPATELA